MKNLDQMNRRSFLTAYMFQVEVLLKRINEILPNVYYEQSYKKLVQGILKELKLSTNYTEKFNIMYYPTIVKNSLHMNGMHSGKNFSGKIDGIKFSFKNKERIEYGEWRHVYFFCDKMLEVIGDILQHPFVGNKYIETLQPRQKIS